MLLLQLDRPRYPHPAVARAAAWHGDISTPRWRLQEALTGREVPVEGRKLYYLIFEVITSEHEKSLCFHFT